MSVTGIVENDTIKLPVHEPDVTKVARDVSRAAQPFVGDAGQETGGSAHRR
jgi:hypothetical protein